MDIYERVEQVREAQAERMGIVEPTYHNFLFLHIDVDKTLTLETCFTPQQCLDAEPRHQMIEVINRLAQKDVIIIYTARQDRLIPATLQWLRHWHVRYDAISNEKRPSDLVIDDKSFNPFEDGNCVVKNKTHKAWQKPQENLLKWNFRQSPND